MYGRSTCLLRALEGAPIPDGQKYEDWLKDKAGCKEGGLERRPVLTSARANFREKAD